MLFLNIMLGKKYLVKHSCINFYFKHKGNRICCVIQVIRMYQWSSKIWSACIFQALKTKHFFFFFHFSNRLHCSGTAQLQVDLMEVEVTTVSTSDT